MTIKCQGNLKKKNIYLLNYLKKDCSSYGALNKFDGLNGIALFHGIFHLFLLGTRVRTNETRCHFSCVSK